MRNKCTRKLNRIVFVQILIAVLRLRDIEPLARRAKYLIFFVPKR